MSGARRRAPGLTTLVVALAGGCLAARGAPAATFEYLHVEAGEGSSAGGHAAIRFGDAVYHFQHRSPGLLVPARDSARAFLWEYGVLENRTIRRAAVAVDDATFARLRDRFNTRYLVERGEVAALDALRRDRELLAAWAAAGGETSAVAGAGPFFVDGQTTAGPGPVSPVLDGLRTRVAARLRPLPLEQLVARQHAAIAGLDVEAASRPVSLDGGGPPDVGYRLSERYDDLLSRLVAARVLADARAVRAAALVTAGPEVPPLGAGERARLVAFGEALAASLARLADAPRPDWGRPLLVGMARLEAIDATLTSGRLVVVAAPDPPSPGAALDDDDARAFARELADAARERLREARLAALRAPAMDEQLYARLERDARDLIAARAAEAGLPSPAAPTPHLASLPRPALDPETLQRAAARAAEGEAAYERVLTERLGYDLLGHNCVTEIFRTIDSELTPAESERLLGGHVASARTAAAVAELDFVPTRSFTRVAATYGDVHTSVVPSYRERRLRAMCHEEPAPLVRLREGNVLTSTLYRPTSEDSAFLFFTDDVPLARPVYGLANLAYGTATAGLGLVALPLDRGRTLRRGAYGVVASLPELAFVSIRKGRMTRGPVAAGDWRPRAGSASAATTPPR